MVKAVLQALCLIHYHKPQDLVPMPEEGEGEEVTDEQREKVNEQNEEIERSNETFAKLKQFAQLLIPGEGESPLPDYAALDEKCLVKLSNFREPVVQDPAGGEGGVGTSQVLNGSVLSKDQQTNKASADPGHVSAHDEASETSSQRALKLIETFELEKLSPKVIVMRAANEGHEGNLMVQNCEAVYFVRKHILEKAKLFWKEAKDANTNYILGMTSQKQRQLDTRFEQHVISRLGWQLGEQFEDQNVRLTFNTFLKENDPRLEE